MRRFQYLCHHRHLRLILPHHLIQHRQQRRYHQHRHLNRLHILYQNHQQQNRQLMRHHLHHFHQLREGAVQKSLIQKRFRSIRLVRFLKCFVLHRSPQPLR
jgi:hypothetical protein